MLNYLISAKRSCPGVEKQEMSWVAETGLLGLSPNKVFIDSTAIVGASASPL